MRELTFMEIEEVGGADGWGWLGDALSSTEQAIVQWGQSIGNWLNSFTPGGSRSTELSAAQAYELLLRCEANGGSISTTTGAGFIGMTVNGKSITVGVQVNGTTITCTKPAT